MKDEMLKELFEEAGSWPKKRLLRIASAEASKNPRAALALWRMADFDVWGRSEKLAETGERFAAWSKAVETPAVVFARNGELGALRLAIREAGKRFGKSSSKQDRETDFWRGTRREFSDAIIAALADGERDEDPRRWLRIIGAPPENERGYGPRIDEDVARKAVRAGNALFLKGFLDFTKKGRGWSGTTASDEQLAAKEVEGSTALTEAAMSSDYSPYNKARDGKLSLLGEALLGERMSNKSMESKRESVIDALLSNGVVPTMLEALHCASIFPEKADALINALGAVSWRKATRAGYLIALDWATSDKRAEARNLSDRWREKGLRIPKEAERPDPDIFGKKAPSIASYALVKKREAEPDWMGKKAWGICGIPESEDAERSSKDARIKRTQSGDFVFTGSVEPAPEMSMDLAASIWTGAPLRRAFHEEGMRLIASMPKMESLIRATVEKGMLDKSMRGKAAERKRRRI